MVEEAQVTLFLRAMKRVVQERFVLVGRKKNLDALARLGMTVDDAKFTILGLMPRHYVSGPSPNRNFAGQHIWVFSVSINEEEIYIKLDLRTDGVSECVCVSFHEAGEAPHRPYQHDE